VADSERRQVVVLEEDGRFRAEFGPFGDDGRPVDVDVRGDELLVTDSGARCVRVLDRQTGQQRAVLGGPGSGGPPLRGPTNLALDSAGKAYVVDTIDPQVLVFDREGAFERTVGTPGSGIGCFARPKGIASDGEVLYVVDAAFENCQLFDLEGRPLMFFGGPGGEPGNLYLPAGIYVGSEGLDLPAAYVDPDFEPTALIVVTSSYGPRKAGFYALGRSTRFETPRRPRGGCRTNYDPERRREYDECASPAFPLALRRDAPMGPLGSSPLPQGSPP
jgi:hypothetical protein